MFHTGASRIEEVIQHPRQLGRWSCPATLVCALPSRLIYFSSSAMQAFLLADETMQSCSCRRLYDFSHLVRHLDRQSARISVPSKDGAGQPEAPTSLPLKTLETCL